MGRWHTVSCHQHPGLLRRTHGWCTLKRTLGWAQQIQPILDMRKLKAGPHDISVPATYEICGLELKQAVNIWLWELKLYGNSSRIVV